MPSSLLTTALNSKCPKCGQGDLYKSGEFIQLHEACPHCGLSYQPCDSADGPAVFLIFVLGFLLVPLALVVEMAIGLPLLVHALLWGALALGITIGTLKPLKAYIIALQYKHTPWD